jgi:hypothetical protein
MYKPPIAMTLLGIGLLAIMAVVALLQITGNKHIKHPMLHKDGYVEDPLQVLM